MSFERILGRGLMTIGAAAASLAFIQLLFQLDSNALPFELSLPAAVAIVAAGVLAVRQGLKLNLA